MTTQEKFEKLKELDINAKLDSQRAKINIELEQLADSDPEGFETAVLASARQTLENVKALKIKEQIELISDIISMSYIAKTYFNKSKAWLSQRVNELDVNGKPAKFLPEEIDTLNFAIRDISNKLATIRIFSLD
jgi:tRNA(Ile)-lysidine synthase TilS/MesJ